MLYLTLSLVLLQILKELQFQNSSVMCCVSVMLNIPVCVWFCVTICYSFSFFLHQVSFLSIVFFFRTNKDNEMKTKKYSVGTWTSNLCSTQYSLYILFYNWRSFLLQCIIVLTWCSLYALFSCMWYFSCDRLLFPTTSIFLIRSEFGHHDDSRIWNEQIYALPTTEQQPSFISPTLIVKPPSKNIILQTGTSWT